MEILETTYKTKQKTPKHYLNLRWVLKMEDFALVAEFAKPVCWVLSPGVSESLGIWAFLYCLFFLSSLGWWGHDSTTGKEDLHIAHGPLQVSPLVSEGEGK